MSPARSCVQIFLTLMASVAALSFADIRERGLVPLPRAFMPAAALAQAAPPSQPAPAQPPSGPADVAGAFAAAAIKHDHAAAANFVTDASRADFLELMELSDRVRKANADLQAAIDRTFRPPKTIRPLERTEHAVLGAEVAAQRPINPDVVEIDMRLSTSKPTEPTVIVSWRVVKVNGAWKIELPQCATPEVAASLKAGLAARLDAVAKTTAAIDRGEFASARQALTTLSNGQRAGAPPARP
jgi:hypothetical protein